MLACDLQFSVPAGFVRLAQQSNSPLKITIDDGTVTVFCTTPFVVVCVEPEVEEVDIDEQAVVLINVRKLETKKDGKMRFAYDSASGTWSADDQVINDVWLESEEGTPRVLNPLQAIKSSQFGPNAVSVCLDARLLNAIQQCVADSELGVRIVIQKPSSEADGAVLVLPPVADADRIRFALLNPVSSYADIAGEREKSESMLRRAVWALDDRERIVFEEAEAETSRGVDDQAATPAERRLQLELIKTAVQSMFEDEEIPEYFGDGTAEHAIAYLRRNGFEPEYYYAVLKQLHQQEADKLVQTAKQEAWPNIQVLLAIYIARYAD